MSARYQFGMMAGFVILFALVILVLANQGMQPYPGGCALYGSAKEVLCQ